MKSNKMIEIEVIDDVTLGAALPPAEKMESFWAIKLLTLSTSDGSFCLAIDDFHFWFGILSYSKEVIECNDC